MALRIAELETLFTANTKGFDSASVEVENKRKRLDGTVADIEVTADTAKALSGLDKVEAGARGLPDAELQVGADTSAATRAMDDLDRDIDTTSTESGEKAGGNLAAGIVAALATIPVVGAVVGIGVAAGKALADAISDGLGVEVRSDRLMATTGLDATTTARLGRAAGEAYANNWGESVQANFDAAGLAVQSSLLDPNATKRDAQDIISSLSGVSDLLGEEVARVSRSSGQLIKNGLAKDADAAFDVIVKGQQAGLNVSEDWLDTIDEYSVAWAALGLDAPTAMGLMSQAVQAGARDTDKAADALKEFQIRATDGSELSAEAYGILGINAEEATAKVSKGGEAATEVLGDVLAKLGEMEPGAERTAAAVGLFGTQSEDLANALGAMDLSTAVDELGEVEGAAETALSTLTDNTQNEIDTAKRNIETAANGIKGALAAAFAPQIEDWATAVSTNREALVGFLLGLANGALDMGRSFVEGIAVSTEAVGVFTAGPLADLVDGVASILNGLDNIPGVDTGDAEKSMRDLAEDMRGADEAAEGFADTMRDKLITEGIDPAQDRLNDLGDTLLNDARLHDSAYALAAGIDAVGTNAKDQQLAIEGYNGSLDKTTEVGALLHTQLEDVAQGMKDEAAASVLAGEGVDEMRDRLDLSYDSLVNQLEQLGLTKDEAEALAEEYGAMPSLVETQVNLDTTVATARLEELRGKLSASGYTGPIAYGDTPWNRGAGAIDYKEMAQGGVLGSPLQPLAQMVPPGTKRVVGDRLDVPEAFIPLDGSARSHALLMEAARRMPGFQYMADGGVLQPQPTIIPQSVTNSTSAPIYIDKLVTDVDGVEREAARRRANSEGVRNA